MQEAIPYRTNWSRDPPTIAATNTGGSDEPMVMKMISENPVVVFGEPSCCMCHVVKKLLLGLGVNPAVYEVEEDHAVAVVEFLTRMNIGLNEGREGTRSSVQFPAVFVGGKLFGGLERVMSTHISGELVPILKDAGALWL
ncbi:Glutaredoxin [Quillaja saponaria]|uniref:Glutaredoxin n=1 Tax=Quillaja saponaria TaxID=32244 RepID=A0AAD7KW75_QUISA|nr:Glutaredoxin [Quillaja saponaria]